MLPETLQYRRDSQDLTVSLGRDWSRLWPLLEIGALNASFPRWLVASMALTGRYRAAAAALGAAYVASLTDFSPLAAAAVQPARFLVSMRVTALIAAKIAMRDGGTQSEASATALTQSLAAAQRYSLDAGRDVVTQTAVADPNCRGWRRVGVGSCHFCAMLIGRGTVYTEATASFTSHDGCHCAPELALT